MDLARPVLKALSNPDAFISSDVTVEQYIDSLQDEEEDEFFIKKRVKQRQRKKSRSQKAPVVLNPKPFEDLGISVPTFQEDAQQCAEEILADQKQILLVRLSLPISSPVSPDCCSLALPRHTPQTRTRGSLQRRVYPERQPRGWRWR